MGNERIDTARCHRVKVPSNRANDRITGLILGRNGRPSPRFARVDRCFPVLCGDIVGSTMGSTVDRDLQSGQEDSSRSMTLVREGRPQGYRRTREPASLDPLAVNSSHDGA